MPLGASRLNFLAKTAEDAASGDIEDAFTLSNLTFVARSYQIPKISYIDFSVRHNH